MSHGFVSFFYPKYIEWHGLAWLVGWCIDLVVTKFSIGMKFIFFSPSLFFLSFCCVYVSHRFVIHVSETNASFNVMESHTFVYLFHTLMFSFTMASIYIVCKPFSICERNEVKVPNTILWKICNILYRRAFQIEDV